MKILISADIKVNFTKNTNFCYEKPYYESIPVNCKHILKHFPKSVANQSTLF